MKSGSESIGSTTCPPDRCFHDGAHGGPADRRWFAGSMRATRRDLYAKRRLMQYADRPPTDAPAADFLVTDGGSVYLVQPLTTAARTYLLRVVGKEAQFLGNAVAVEHRYVGDFVAALAEDGFVIAGES
jgi:hypothetical protein